MAKKRTFLQAETSSGHLLILRQFLPDDRLQLRSLHHPGLLPDHMSVPEQDERRYTTHLIADGHIGILLRVDLDHMDLIAHTGFELLEDGGHHAAGGTPVGVEIYQDRRVAFDQFGKTLVSNVVIHDMSDILVTGGPIKGGLLIGNRCILHGKQGSLTGNQGASVLQCVFFRVFPGFRSVGLTASASAMTHHATCIGNPLE